MTAVLQARDVLRSNKLMSPPEDHSFPSSTDWETKYRDSEAKRHELEALLEDTRLELDEFQTSSRELEEELEKDLERSEKAKLDLENKVAKIDSEKDDWKSKFMSLQTTYNTTTASLQRELDTLRQDHQKIKVQLRELEMGNDDLERNERAISSSLADTEQKYSRVLEEKILLEHELLDKATLEEESQRLKDELRDANEENTILKERLASAQKAASVSDLPTSSAASATSHTPSDDESLLSTPAPAGLSLVDLNQSEAPAKDFSPIVTKTPQASYHPYGQASLLQRAGFQPPKSGISTPPSALARSSTLPSFSSTPSRIPPRTPIPRPVTNRTVSTMSSTSTVTGTTTKSRGVQMVSEMRARVKVLEQKIGTRVPRLRMPSVTNRVNGNAPSTPRAGPSGISSPSNSSSSSLRRKLSPEKNTGSGLKPRRQSNDSDSENRRTPASDTSGWVLIMEDSPSPVKDKDKEKERRRTSSPTAPSAFRALTSPSMGSPIPSNSGSRAPSALSQSGAGANRRPLSRLSVSTEGRSSISTIATTSTTSSIPTPISRPSTPTFLPVPTSGLYQNGNGVGGGSKRSTGPGSGAYSQSQKRSSFGSSHSNLSTSTVVPASQISLIKPHPNVTTRGTPKGALGQSRIGKPGGVGHGRKNVNGGTTMGGGDESAQSDSGSGTSGKFNRGRSGSTSIFFGRDRN